MGVWETVQSYELKPPKATESFSPGDQGGFDIYWAFGHSSHWIYIFYKYITECGGKCLLNFRTGEVEAGRLRVQGHSKTSECVSK